MKFVKLNQDQLNLIMNTLGEVPSKISFPALDMLRKLQFYDEPVAKPPVHPLPPDVPTPSH